MIRRLRSLRRLFRYAPYAVATSLLTRYAFIAMRCRRRCIFYADSCRLIFDTDDTAYFMSRFAMPFAAALMSLRHTLTLPLLRATP